MSRALERQDVVPHVARYFVNRRRWSRHRLKRDLENRTKSFAKWDEVTVETVEGIGVVIETNSTTNTVKVSFRGGLAVGYNAAIVHRYKP